jgi:hypothetical protein
MTTTTTTKSTQTTTTSSYSSSVACAGHYWPIGKNAVTDVITGKNATSASPLFATDRFGVSNGAIQVNSGANAWRLPNDTYFTGDFTMTMWLYKKISCSQGGFYGMC